MIKRSRTCAAANILLLFNAQSFVNRGQRYGSNSFLERKVIGLGIYDAGGATGHGGITTREIPFEKLAISFTLGKGF